MGPGWPCEEGCISICCSWGLPGKESPKPPGGAVSVLEFKGGTRETTEALEGGKELIAVVEVVRSGEEVARSFGRVTPSIVVVAAAVVGAMVTDSLPGSVTVATPGPAEDRFWEFAADSSCWFSMLSIPGGTMTTLSSESLAREISTSSASSLS